MNATALAQLDSLEAETAQVHAETLEQLRRLQSTRGSSLRELALGSPQPEVAVRTREMIRQQWECSVMSVAPDSFEAILRPVRQSQSQSDAVLFTTVQLDEISQDDVELLMPGAVFDWVVGFQESAGGTRTGFSRMKFRRLPSWTAREIREAKSRAAEMLAAFGETDE